MSSNIFAANVYYAGNVIVSQSLNVPTITAQAIYGTSNTSTAAYVPQDFSSSGLNIPAYVVSNTATTANTVQYSSFGPFAGEGSLYFPGGSAQGVYMPPSTVPQVNFSWNTTVCTLEFWFFPTKPGGAQTIVSHCQGPLQNPSVYEAQMYISPSDKLGFYAPAGGNFASSASVNYNAWNHAAFSFTGGTLYLALNGVVASGAATPGFTSTYVLNIGSERSSIGSYTYYGYISNFRIITGLALYQTSFTPPTAPLQPIQGVTQAGLPYGTVLLLRNAPAPGRIQTTKFSGANSGQVLSFPPAAMTGYSTALNAGYGQGTYVASASSENSGEVAWYAFDKSTSTFWRSPTAYTANTPYSGSVRTVDVNGTSYAGEWCQIQLPSSIVLSNYVIYGVGGNMPTVWYVLGSRDGTNWNLVDQRNFNSWTGYTTFTVSGSQSFTYYRFVGNTSNGATLAFYEWTLNGSIESVNVTADGRVGLGVVNPTRALEVAGDVVCAGTLSAGNPLMFRNRIINGDMRINQRGATSLSVTQSAAAAQFFVDRFYTVTNATTGYFTDSLQTLSASDTPYQYGFKYSMRCTATTGVALPSGYIYPIGQNIEGYNTVDLNWGTPFASSVTVSFWFRSNMAAGSISSFSLRNALAGGSGWATYVANFNVVGGGTWQYVTSTIPPPPSNSTWNYTTSAGIECTISSTSSGGSPLGWSTSALPGSTNQTTWWTTTGNYVEATGVQLEKGTVATPFEIRPFGVELQLCKRYFHTINCTGGQSVFTGLAGGSASHGTNSAIMSFNLPVPMRVVPTGYFYSDSSPQIMYNGTYYTINFIYDYAGGVDNALPGTGRNYGYDSATNTTFVSFLPVAGSGPNVANVIYIVRNLHVDFNSEL